MDQKPDQKPEPKPLVANHGRQTAKVVRLERPASEPVRMGRPKKLKPPPMPEELLEAFTPLEREHWDYFIESYAQDYGIKKPSDWIALRLAACEYIQLLRVNATAAASGEVITAARQHPGVQLRAWLDSMGGTRKQRKDDKQDDDAAAWMSAMSKLSS